MIHKPDFLIIGAMKAGTSSLHYYLSQHPDIRMSTPKEIHFFDEKNFSIEKIDKYCENFVKRKEEIVGTTPQSYSKTHKPNYENVPKRIKKYLPKIKLVYIVRDPIDRIYSHFKEQQSGGYHTSQNINDYLRDINNSHLLMTSRYFYQISNYLKYFSKSHIKVLTLEDLNKNPEKVLNQLFEFLDVDNLSIESLNLNIKNSSESKNRKEFVTARIPKPIKNIYRNLISERIREMVYKTFLRRLYIKKSISQASIDKSLEIKIKKILLDDSLMLEKAFNIDLPYIKSLK
ncbi:MAG: sulfotransferase domain-containing protein [Bacteroidota bacterium]